jgi:tetratricopeptide (TPR) repeat protein
MKTALSLLILCFFLVSPVAHAQTVPVPPDHEKEYKACLELVKIKPDKAMIAAAYWMSIGGGIGAAHCSALAMVGLQKYTDAADVFLQISATDAPLPEEVRARMMAQAAHATLLARQPEKAIDMLSRAIVVKDNEQYRIDRALAYASLQNYQEALHDLNTVLDENPRQGEALTFRANIYRLQGNVPAAQKDITTALNTNPKLQVAWLEQGTLLQMQGKHDAAKQAWQKTIALDATTDAAILAQKNLEALQ